MTNASNSVQDITQLMEQLLSVVGDKSSILALSALLSACGTLGGRRNCMPLAADAMAKAATGLLHHARTLRAAAPQPGPKAFNLEEFLRASTLFFERIRAAADGFEHDVVLAALLALYREDAIRYHCCTASAAEKLQEVAAELSAIEASRASGSTQVH